MTATAANQQQFSFLQEKIKEIGSAIFFNQSDSLLKLPTSIVTTLKVDDYGYVWFFVQKPRQSLKEFDKEFPVRLDFYKKGMSYFLQVAGKGWVVTDPEDLNAFVSWPEELSQIAKDEMVLVKVKIMKAEYFERNSAKSKSSWWKNAIGSFTTWLGHSNSYRPDVYYPAS